MAAIEFEDSQCLELESVPILVPTPAPPLLHSATRESMVLNWKLPQPPGISQRLEVQYAQVTPRIHRRTEDYLERLTEMLEQNANVNLGSPDDNNNENSQNQSDKDNGNKQLSQKGNGAGSGKGSGASSLGGSSSRKDANRDVFRKLETEEDTLGECPLKVSLSLRLGVYLSILLVSYLIWSGA